MNGEEFFNAINMIDDDLVDEAAFVRKTGKKNRKVYFTLAACLAVFMCAGVILSGFGLFPSYETAEDSAEGIHGTTSNENILHSSADNKAPESADPEDSTEALSPEMSAPVQGENIYTSGATGQKENEMQTGVEVNEDNTSESISEGHSAPPNQTQPPAEEATNDENGDNNSHIAVFTAKIIKIDGNTVTVEPLEEPERSSSDRIVFSKAELEEINVKKGDTVVITYDGIVMETYPAKINALEWKRAE